jgi:hypothetical protein
MMFAVVYLSSKLGQVSGQGLFAVIKDNYPRWILFPRRLDHRGNDADAALVPGSGPPSACERGSGSRARARGARIGRRTALKMMLLFRGGPQIVVVNAPWYLLLRHRHRRWRRWRVRGGRIPLATRTAET